MPPCGRRPLANVHARLGVKACACMRAAPRVCWPSRTRAHVCARGAASHACAHAPVQERVADKVELCKLWLFDSALSDAGAAAVARLMRGGALLEVHLSHNALTAKGALACAACGGEGGCSSCVCCCTRACAWPPPSHKPVTVLPSLLTSMPCPAHVHPPSGAALLLEAVPLERPLGRPLWLRLEVRACMRACACARQCALCAPHAAVHSSPHAHAHCARHAVEPHRPGGAGGRAGAHAGTQGAAGGDPRGEGSGQVAAKGGCMGAGEAACVPQLRGGSVLRWSRVPACVLMCMHVCGAVLLRRS